MNWADHNTVRIYAFTGNTSHQGNNSRFRFRSESGWETLLYIGTARNHHRGHYFTLRNHKNGRMLSSWPRSLAHFSSAVTISINVAAWASGYFCNMPEKYDSPSPPPGLGIIKELPAINEDSERKAVRRIDYTVIPVISMYYLLAFLVSTSAFDSDVELNEYFILQDRINIGISDTTLLRGIPLISCTLFSKCSPRWVAEEPWNDRLTVPNLYYSILCVRQSIWFSSCDSPLTEPFLALTFWRSYLRASSCARLAPAFWCLYFSRPGGVL